jgi:uncharacterized membrane protein YczE
VRTWFLRTPPDRRLERFTRCIAGLALFGLGSAMFFASDLGAAPWDVFHEGVAERLGLPVGLVIELVGLAIVAAWFPLGLRPGWGTLLNAIEIGLVVMLVDGMLPTGGHLAARVAYMLGGLLSIGIGSGIYIGVGLGTGPRDGLMLGLSNDRISVRMTRTLIEATVLVAGIALGGTAGVGTALFALGIGPVVQYMLPRLSMRPSAMAIGDATGGPAGVRVRATEPRSAS